MGKKSVDQDALDRLARQHERSYFFARHTPKEHWNVPFEDERNTLDMRDAGLSIAILTAVIVFITILVF